MWRALALVLTLCATPLRAGYVHPAEPDVAAFVEANMIAVFYHEAAHALIDTLHLPVPGREEDAADALAAILIDRLWGEEAAAELVTENALAYRLFDEQSQGLPQVYWNDHSLDIQRYYTLVCLFYGANPDQREALARDLELPDERRESCPGEWQAAADNWGTMLADMPPQDHLKGFRLVQAAGQSPLTRLIADEVEALNGEYGLPVRIDVIVEPCGEANAFYDPRARRIVMCTDYAEELARLYRNAFPQE